MVTIHDVARASGVAISTVSNVLTNANRPVSAGVREKVLRAARDLNYHPNTTAQALVRRRTDTIGVVAAFVTAGDIVTSSYAVGILHGVLIAAEQAGQNVTLYTHYWRSAEESAAVFRDRRTDGLLLIAPPTDTDILVTLASLGVPLVTVSAPEIEGVPMVDVDDRRGAWLAVKHLADLGHRRIAYIHGNENHTSTGNRREGFLEAMREMGLSIPEHFVVPADYGGAGVAQACVRLLGGEHRPTALFAGNDAIAIAALHAAAVLGIHTPRDLSIVGYDDSPSASLISPALTTVLQPLAEMGAAAVKALACVIDGKETAEKRRILQPELVVRESTAPVKSVG